MDYNADFRYDLKVGQAGEKLLAEMLGGTKGDTIEVKSEIDRWSDCPIGIYSCHLPNHHLPSLVHLHGWQGYRALESS